MDVPARGIGSLNDMALEPRGTGSLNRMAENLSSADVGSNDGNGGTGSSVS